MLLLKRDGWRPSRKIRSLLYCFLRDTRAECKPTGSAFRTTTRAFLAVLPHVPQEHKLFSPATRHPPTTAAHGLLVAKDPRQSRRQTRPLLASLNRQCCGPRWPQKMARTPQTEQDMMLCNVHTGRNRLISSWLRSYNTINTKMGL